MNAKPRPGIFAWYIQLPLAVVCAAIYWHARLYEARREPVAMGIAYGALVVAAYDLFLRWKLKKHKASTTGRTAEIASPPSKPSQ